MFNYRISVVASLKKNSSPKLRNRFHSHLPSLIIGHASRDFPIKNLLQAQINFIFFIPAQMKKKNNDETL